MEDMYNIYLMCHGDNTKPIILSLNKYNSTCISTRQYNTQNITISNRVYIEKNTVWKQAKVDIRKK